MADYRVTTGQLTQIADAIRQKGGTLELLRFPDGFVSAVSALSAGGGSGIDTSDATATAADLLNGKTAYADGEKLIGTFVPDGYQIVTGEWTTDGEVDDEELILELADLPFAPEGAVMYNYSAHNGTYYLNGGKTFLFGYGTTTRTGNRAFCWEYRFGQGGHMQLCSFSVNLYQGWLVLTTDATFNGPYRYMIWGK